jgi:serine O-acetyltransferase
MKTPAHSETPSLTPAMIWPRLRAEAETVRKKEHVLAALVENNVLSETGFLAALGRMLAGKLASADVSADALRTTFTTVYQAAPALEASAQYDLISVMAHDPAAHDLLTPFLFFKGFHALQSYRIAHWLWHHDRQHLALYLQNRISCLFGVDIHPAARIGHGVMMDHATGIVVGETAVVENDVLFWHGVTLGGKTLTGGDRHPKIRKGVHLGAGSTVLGPIEVGAGAQVAAGSVVLENVPAGVTVAGIPAKVVSKT